LIHIEAFVIKNGGTRFLPSGTGTGTGTGTGFAHLDSSLSHAKSKHQKAKTKEQPSERLAGELEDASCIHFKGL
jgi:hypothetical protein